MVTENPVASGGFRITVDTLTVGIQHTDHAFDNVEDDLRTLVDQMVNDAKENAPWTDNTGAAREELDATVERDGDVFVVTLSHGVDYGQWLETIQSGQYAIIMPTIERWAPKILEAVGGSIVGEENS
jgi:hypothetical protein